MAMYRRKHKFVGMGIYTQKKYNATNRKYFYLTDIYFRIDNLFDSTQDRACS